MAAVKTVSLTKEYSNGEHYLRAVADISFTVEENEFVAIMGSSGCGKTTLLNLLGGLDRKSTRLNSSHSQQSRMPSSA